MDKMFKIRRAMMDDVEDVLNHYKIVISQIKNNKNNPGWNYGIYPKEEKLITSIETGNMYIGIIDSKIVSSIVIDHNPISNHESINWLVDCDDAYYIHLVAVNQDYKKRGLAGVMLEYAFELCRLDGVRSIRLSINKKNIQIEKVYLRHGFINVDQIEVDDDKRGLLNFEIYEKIID